MNDPFANTDPFFFDENLWVNELYNSLKAILEQSLTPLDEFLKCFDVYKDVLKLKPEEYIKKVENDEKPKEVEALRDEINEFTEKEKKLRESMPESV